MNKISCLDGEQYDVTEKRCISCDKYNLEWDPVFKKCRPVLKKQIVITDDKNQIIGYL
jgi:hypothetical protein